jgi:allophanate hydrolase
LHAARPGAPRKPGLLRVAEGGAAIAVEVWELPQSQVGLPGADPAAAGAGQVELADGRRVHGFLCEPVRAGGRRDITVHGGWRAYLASR